MSETLAEIVRKIRGNKTQTEFADELNVHINTISRIEVGKRKISVDMAYKLLDLAGNEYKLEDFLKREG